MPKKKTKKVETETDSQDLFHFIVRSIQPRYKRTIQLPYIFNTIQIGGLSKEKQVLNQFIGLRSHTLLSIKLCDS